MRAPTSTRLTQYAARLRRKRDSASTPSPSSRARKVPRNSSKAEARSAPTSPEELIAFPPALPPAGVEVHTLILGTFPSVKSLEKTEYYGFPRNAFWWIVGDWLGHRRDIKNGNRGQYYTSITLSTPVDAPILSYDEQLEALLRRGFGLWDVIGACRRKGSLDSAIKKGVAADVRGLCNSERGAHIQRLCFSSGGTTFAFFRKQAVNEVWLKVPGAFCVDVDDTLTRDYVGNAGKKYAHILTSTTGITLCSLPSISSANARTAYALKREAWLKGCYEAPRKCASK